MFRYTGIYKGMCMYIYIYSFGGCDAVEGWFYRVNLFVFASSHMI